jgi:hypothetical protein
VSLNQQNSSQILQTQYHQYLVKNGKPEPSELSSSYSRELKMVVAGGRALE